MVAKLRQFERSEVRAGVRVGDGLVGVNPHRSNVLLLRVGFGHDPAVGSDEKGRQGLGRRSIVDTANEDAVFERPRDQEAISELIPALDGVVDVHDQLSPLLLECLPGFREDDLAADLNPDDRVADAKHR